MAKGGRRRRPKQIQPESRSTPEQPVFGEGDMIEGVEILAEAVSTVQGNGKVMTPLCL